MTVYECMTREVVFCSTTADLSDAAMIMWLRDCAFVPVVEEPSRRLVGVITDRDICMAAATRHRPPIEIPVAEVMTRHVWTCAPSEELQAALDRMREGQVRRLPVVDGQGRLVGVLSSTDAARLRGDAVPAGVGEERS